MLLRGAGRSGPAAAYEVRAALDEEDWLGLLCVLPAPRNTGQSQRV